jgi:4-hydroxy-tetrahydrodipicolinate synthase
MFNKDTYGRILVPIVTPYAKDQSVDHGKLAALADHLITTKRADTLILSGTTGEFHTQSFAERVAIFETVSKAAAGRMPLIAGVGCTSTRETIALAKEAERLGFPTVMVVAPYYTKPSQSEILGHYRAVAEAVPSLDIMLYNIPIFTGVNVDPTTVATLAKLPNVVAIKEEAELNPKQMTAFLNVTPDDFIVYNGDDTMILEAYAQGGRQRIGGVVSGASHVVGDYIRTMIDTFLGGDIDGAAAMQRKLYPVLKVMGLGGRTNPVCLWKDAIRLTGVDAGLPRLPMTPGTPEEVEAVRKALQDFGIL